MSAGPSREEILALIQAAEQAAVTADPTVDRYTAALAALTRDADDPDRDPAIEVAAQTVAMVTRAYEGGWQPLDLMHVVRWRGSRQAGPWMARAILREAERSEARARAPQRWRDQLDRVSEELPGTSGGTLLRPVDAAQWKAALECLGVMHSLPTVEVIVPPPSAWDRPDVRIRFRHDSGRPEDKILVRIRSLLAKAESTEFPAEADALTAKAQDLMTRHSVDEALVRAEHHDQTRVGAIRVVLEPPYTKEKAVILHVVAKANHARAVWNDWADFVTLVGVDTDLDHVEMLFTSLLVQATRSMTAAGDGPETRSIGFRKSFFSGYAVRLGDRLDEAVHVAEESYGGSLLPVRVAQEAAVTEEVERLFPELRVNHRGASSFDARGWTAGQEAADAAILPQGQLGAAEDA